MKKQLIVLTAACLLGALVAPSFATESTLPTSAITPTEAKAEAARLQDEMERFARSNAWGAVERTYESLAALGPVDVGPRAHVLAGVAAHLDLDISSAIRRLTLGGAVGHEELAAVRRAYGVVVLSRADGEHLTVAGVSDDPRARALLARASHELEATGQYRGWLPVGAYSVGARSFSVPAVGAIASR